MNRNAAIITKNIEYGVRRVELINLLRLINLNKTRRDYFLSLLICVLMASQHVA